MSRYRRQSSNLLACFNPAAAAEDDVDPAPPPPPPPPPARAPTHPNLTTSLYRTESGTFGLTWSRDSLFSRSLHIHINHQAKPCFHLQIKPWNWNKRGSHNLTATAAVQWDLTRAKFGSGPAPSSGFYVAIVVNGNVQVLVGDASPAVRHRKQQQQQQEQAMFLRREHVYGSKQMVYETKTDFGDINIDCRLDDSDPRLYMSIAGKRVLQIKHLKWKFRGSERIHVAGLPGIQVSWDVHSWLFHPDPDSDGYALFMFKFQNPDSDNQWNHHHHHHLTQPQYSSTCGLGFETRKMNKGLKMLKSAGRRRNHSSAASSSSLSSASSGCSSVMEWESVEETELKDPAAFSLLVYAWKT